MAYSNTSRTSSKSSSPTSNKGGNKNNKGIASSTTNVVSALNKVPVLFPESPDPSSPQATLPPLPLLPKGAETINLTRETFNRKEFNATFTTNFTQLGIAEEVDMNFFDPSLATVGDFFTIYQSLFLQIPKVGEVNSHEFLIEQSTEYTQFIAQQEEINALQEEITDLRIQNVDLVAEMANIVAGFETTIANLTEQGIG